MGNLTPQSQKLVNTLAQTATQPKTVGIEFLKEKILNGPNKVDPAHLELYIKLYSDADTMMQVYTAHFKEQLQGKKLKVKMVIIDLENWHDNKLLGVVVGSLVDFLGFTQYGLTHVGVQIGSSILHWFNDSIAHFTDIQSSSPLLAVDVGELDLDQTLDYMKLKKVCELAAHYNLNYKYSNAAKNCHHFVDEILQVLGMSSEFPGQTGEYLKRLRKNVMEKEFTCPLTKTKHVFRTHKEVDRYVNDFKTKVQKEDLQDGGKYASDYTLLKAFDRGFWLLKYGLDRKSEVSPEEMDVACEDRCPFQDPFTTSFVPKKAAGAKSTTTASTSGSTMYN